MFNKLIVAAVFAITPMVLAEDSSAQHCSSGYRAYRAPAVHHHHGHGHAYRGAYVRPSINSYYRAPYRSAYGHRAGYGGFGYGGYGSYGSYGGLRGGGYGNSIGVGRGGISVNIGF